MIIDTQCQFSEDQDLSQTAGAYDSTNVVQLPANSSDGNPVRIWVQVTDTFESGGAATLAIDLETATDAAFSSPVTIASISALALATLVEGYRVPIDFLPRTDLGFLRLEYTIGTATTTAGTVSAGIVFDVQSSKGTFPTGSNP